MYYSLALLSGLLIAVMVAINGILTVSFGVWYAGLVVHTAGLVTVSVIFLLSRQKIKFARLKWTLYMGGIVGIFTVMFNNYAFAHISLSAITAFSLLGMMLSSFAIDEWGLWGMEKHPFEPVKLIGIGFSMIGIVVLMIGTSWQLVPILAAFATGITIVWSRTICAALAKETDVWSSTFVNYVGGLLASIVLVLVFDAGGFRTLPWNEIPVWGYFGGVIGCILVYLSSVLVLNISQLYLTILTLSGQIFGSLAVDALLSGGFSVKSAVGGAFIFLGQCINLYLDYKRRKARGERLS